MKEAKFWKPLANDIVQCNACNRHCAIKPGDVGKCRVRKNVSGKLMSLVYGKTLTLTIDPIEKKPLFHFRPGSHCAGVSTYGCNFSCLHCQNYHISQQFTEEVIESSNETSPEQIVENSLENNADGIAYTYTEPTIFVEYALDTMKIAKEKKLYNVWVSNGYMTKEVADAIIPYLDGINIDLKGNDKFYSEVCGEIRIDVVKENIKYFNEKGVHVEVTNLIIPGYNDSEDDFRKVAEFIKSINPDMPLHFTRFFPMNKMDYLPPTDASKIAAAKKIAEEIGVHYVYEGNLGGEEDTKCKKCGKLIVKRKGYDIDLVGLKGKNCSKCGAENNFI